MDNGERDRTAGDDPLLASTGSGRSNVVIQETYGDRLELFGQPVRSVDRRVLVLVGCIVVAAVVAAGGWWLTRGEHVRSVPPPGAAAIDVWAPSWTIDEVLTDGTDRFELVREFSTFWYETVGIDVGGLGEVDGDAPGLGEQHRVRRDRDGVENVGAGAHLPRVGRVVPWARQAG
jgi:hypothetical protein